MLLNGTIAAEMAVSFWILSNTISKKVIKGFGPQFVAIVVIALGLLPMAVSVALMHTYSMPFYSILMASFAGIALGTGFVSIYMSLKTEQLANASALNEIQPAALVLFGLVILHEHVTILQIVSMLVIFAGAMLIITGERFKINRALLPAALAGFCWAVYWILMEYAISSAREFSLPILVSRLIGLALAIGVLLWMGGVKTAIRRRRRLMRSEGVFGLMIILLIIMGIADGCGDAIFGITAISKVFAIGGALTALSPMVVVFLGFLFYRERLNKTQMAGFFVMVAGAVILSVL